MTRYTTALLLSFALSVAASAAGESAALERIARTGKMVIGYVPDAPPMSFREDDKVQGYSIDLCKQIADKVQDRLGIAKLTLSYVPLIAPEDRMRAVESGRVDIECGATTVTMSRRERVDFTLLTYITGGSVLSLVKNGIASTAELHGKHIAVITDTTTERAIRKFRSVNDFDIRLRPIDSHDEGLRLLNDGEVEGYASDRTMLIGQALRTDEATRYQLASDVFSFEPYAFMIQRGDSEFRLLADRALAEIYLSARIKRLYSDWFGQTGEAMSPVVEAMYEFQAVED